MPRELAQKFHSLRSGIRLENCYGPTEATIYCSSYDTAGLNGWGEMPIGQPLNNAKLYILDRHNKLQPTGVVGELWIGGSSLARGYLGNAQLTDSRFIYNQWIGERIYRTGDVARWLPDGNIEFKGRTDEQVKIRGYRIELGEIENRLLQHEQILEAVVIAREEENGKCLVAYYVSEKEIEVSGLRSYLSEKLPAYMIPSYWVNLEKMPLTANGKLNRKALPAPDVKAGSNYAAPVTAKEKLMTDIWMKVLGVEKVGITDNFFMVGGDSIKSTQIVSRLRSAGYELSVKDIFTSQTIKELCLKLKACTTISDQSVITGKAMLTPVQQWFFNSGIVNKDHYNQSVLLHFSGGISEDVTRLIFGHLQRHHDALRMVFRPENGQLIQINRGIEQPLLVEVCDRRGLAEEESEILSFYNKIQTGLDITNGPVIKLGLLQLSTASRLLIVIHHLVIDGISWRILFEDISMLYQQQKNGDPFSLPLKTDAFLQWSGHLLKYSQRKNI